MNKRGFTLVEILIAVSIFTLAAVIASNILVNVVKLEKKSSIQNAIYEDARILLQELSKEIQSSGIDYEEYYSINVLQSNKPADGSKTYYGINYGVYGSRFYDPGRSKNKVIVKNPDDLGVECTVPKAAPNNDECEVIFSPSSDFSTGQSPYEAAAINANAFCDAKGINCDNKVLVNKINAGSELYLIDSTGTKKTILGLKKISGNNFGIGLVRLYGRDMDQNGIVDVFACEKEFTCHDDYQDLRALIKYPFLQDIISNDIQWKNYVKENDIRLPQKSDLNKAFLDYVQGSQFLPISPLRANIKNLQFIVTPLEDPYKGYKEKAMQTHPTVTIIMTIGLSTETAANYPGDFEDITLQTTVAAGVIGEIESYPAVGDIKKPGDASWIKAAFEALNVN